MPISDNIPVPVMTSMSLPFNLLIALKHRYSSTGIPIKTLLSNLIALLFILGSGLSLIGKAEMLCLDAVSSGPEQMQLISAFGTYLRRLYNIACSVHSLPKFPAPKFPKKAIFRRVGSVLICYTARWILGAGMCTYVAFIGCRPCIPDKPEILPIPTRVKHVRYSWDHVT